MIVWATIYVWMGPPMLVGSCVVCACAVPEKALINHYKLITLITLISLITLIALIALIALITLITLVTLMP
jgi:hypothetical protein